jgi:hypothetical protein
LADRHESAEFSQKFAASSSVRRSSASIQNPSLRSDFPARAKTVRSLPRRYRFALPILGLRRKRDHCTKIIVDVI